MRTRSIYCPGGTSASVPAEHQRLEGKQQRLETQEYRVHEADGIDGVKNHTLRGAGVLVVNLLVAAGIGVGDAAAAGRDVVDPAFVERLEKNQKGARPR